MSSPVTLCGRARITMVAALTLRCVCVARCASCCSSVARGSCVCRSGSRPCRRGRRRRSPGTWPPWCWRGNHAPVTSCIGKTWRLFTRGGFQSPFYTLSRLLYIWFIIPPYIHISWNSSLCHLFLRYASLYFCLAIENQENELLGLEVIHRYVELLDKYFGNVFHWVSPSFIQYAPAASSETVKMWLYLKSRAHYLQFNVKM